MAKKTDTGTALQELKQALKSKQVGRLYVFHGEETFLLYHYLGQIKKLLLHLQLMDGTLRLHFIR